METVIKISLTVQDLSMEQAQAILQVLENLGGTANGKITEIDLDSGETTKKKFVLNNVLKDTLFGKANDNVVSHD